MIRSPMPVLRRIAGDQTGSTIVEFGFVAPLLCLLLVGLFDFGFQIYAQTSMAGALQEAARKSALEPTVITTAQLDADVTEAVHNIVPGATVTFSRKNYESFSDVRKPEKFTDTNGNGECDNNEPFDDVNGNLTWDEDRGRDGLGGAQDAVYYSASATYDRVFPLDGFLNVPAKITIDAGTVLRNQPYDEQADRPPVVGNCS